MPAAAGSSPVGLVGRAVLELRGRELGDLRRETGGIALEDEQADLGEHRLDGRHGQRLALGQQDLLGARRPRSLVGVEELLVDLLSRPAADDLHVDVALGVETGELDHRSSELDDAYWLAHVEHEHLGAARAAAVPSTSAPAADSASPAEASEPERMIS